MALNVLGSLTNPRLSHGMWKGYKGNEAILENGKRRGRVRVVCKQKMFPKRTFLRDLEMFAHSPLPHRDRTADTRSVRQRCLSFSLSLYSSLLLSVIHSHTLRNTLFPLTHTHAYAHKHTGRGVANREDTFDESKGWRRSRMYIT